MPKQQMLSCLIVPYISLIKVINSRGYYMPYSRVKYVPLLNITYIGNKVPSLGSKKELYNRVILYSIILDCFYVFKQIKTIFSAIIKGYFNRYKEG